MPTPFTHLAVAQRLLVDDHIPDAIRTTLETNLSAFLLGNIAADARTNGDIRREDTHFYAYDRPMLQPPWREMFTLHPTLHHTHSSGQRAFLAGYVAHLAMDEFWSLNMLTPHFALREWASRPVRFLMLHLLLIYMDERDYGLLLPWQWETLAAAQPDDWTPFLSDAILRDWRDFIDDQIKPGGMSQTLLVFGGRINKTPAELRAILDSEEDMQSGLWANITPELLADIETRMYEYAREQMHIYWDESTNQS